MTYYLIPRTSFLLHKQIDCISTDSKPGVAISNSLSRFLYEIKEKLDYHEELWDKYKKFTNPYEYIHSIPTYKKKSVSKYKPLSRSYFKMIEMIQLFNLRYDTTPIRTFHLAEGPGGFIEAIANVRNRQEDVYIGMSILDDANDTNIPAWKKSDAFLKSHPNVKIECGADGTGNILSVENLEYCRNKYRSSMELITADGGFDFSFDFNNQEISISKLLFGQVCYALTMQKLGGSFILKIFDSFMEHTMDILYILSSFYERVYIIKPQTSRYANSEKYIVCKNFLFSSCENFYPTLVKAFTKMLLLENEKYIQRFLIIPISYHFIIKMEELNSIFGQQQIENIHFTISLIDNKNRQDKLDNLTKVNLQKCIQWCIKYKIDHNNILSL